MAGLDRLRRVAARPLAPAGGPSRHDLVLAVIPAAFLVVVSVGAAVGVPDRTAVAVASVVTALLTLDALFLHPPRGPSTRRGAS